MAANPTNLIKLAYKIYVGRYKIKITETYAIFAM